MAPLFFLEEKLLILISSFLKHFNCKYMYLFFSKKIEETFKEVGRRIFRRANNKWKRVWNMQASRWSKQGQYDSMYVSNDE